MTTTRSLLSSGYSAFAKRFLLGLLVLVLVAIGLLYGFLGSDAGTRFLLQRFAQNDSVALRYESGNFRDGAWVRDVRIKQEDMEIAVNRAYLKVGLGSLFAKRAHIKSAQIDDVTIDNRKPPSGEPFDYPTLRLPVTLRLEDTQVRRARYRQVGSEDLVFSDVYLKDALWRAETVRLTQAAATINDDVVLSDVGGSMRLLGDYPMDLQGNINVASLNAHYIAPMRAKLGGSLKRATGSVSGAYNQSAVWGRFAVEPLEEGIPFWAQLEFDTLIVPYATDQRIALSSGIAQASGSVFDMDLRINTHLDAKDVPSGHYQGQARLTFEGMTVERLVATTAEGVLTANGQMRWSDDFALQSRLSSTDFALRRAAPSEYQDWSAYLPERFNGELDFDFWTNDSGHTRYLVDLAQNDGERVRVDIRQANAKTPDNPNPWLVDVSWQRFIRDDLPGVGKARIDDLQAALRIDEQTLIDAKADVAQFSALPKGHYAANLRIADAIVYVDAARHQGEIGDLKAKGVAHLPSQDRPLTYAFEAQSDKLSPNAYLGKSTPVDYLSGKINLSGAMEGDAHRLSLKNADLTASVDGKNARFVGKAAAAFLLGERFDKLEATIDGQLLAADFGKAWQKNTLSAKIKGDAAQIQLVDLQAKGDIGSLVATGKAGFDPTPTWQIKADLNAFDAGQIIQDATDRKVKGRLTGVLQSQGAYKDKWTATVDFDGAIASNLGDGQATLSAAVDDKKIAINRLEYQGQAGELSGGAWIDTGRGVAAQTRFALRNFDPSYFASDYKGKISGEIDAFVDWQKDKQRVHLSKMDIQGELNGEPLIATGSIEAVLDAPSDFGAYMQSLKEGGFDLDKALAKQTPAATPDRLTRLSQRAGQWQENLAKKDEQIRRVIQQLDVKNAQLLLGDNRLFMHGNQNRLAVEIQAQSLSQIAPTVRGQIKAALVLLSDQSSLPTVYVDAQVKGLSAPSFAVREGSVLARVVNLGNASSAVVAQAVGFTAAGRSAQQARLDFSGTTQNHNVSFFVNDGNLKAQARLQGGFDGRYYSGAFSEGRLQTRFGALNQNQGAELRYDTQTAHIQVAAHCWQTLSAHLLADDSRGSLCLKDDLRFDPKQAQIDLEIKNLDAAVFTPLLPSDLSVRGRLNGAVNARFGGFAPNGKPFVNAFVYSDGGQVGLRNEAAPDTTMAYDRVALVATTADDGLRIQGKIQAQSAGNGAFEALIDPYQDNKPIKGSLRFDRIDLSVLRPFFPSLRALAGEMNAQGELGGDLKNPLFFGKVRLQGGVVALIDAPLSFENIDLSVDINGQNADAMGTFTSGDGEGVIAGTVDWQSDLVARLSLKGQKLAISSPPLLSAQVNVHLETLLRPTQKYVDIKGVIAVPEAILRPPETTASVTVQSPDVVVIDRRAQARIEEILQRAQPWSINADIGLDLGDDVVFRGFGANLPLAGALHLTQSGQESLRAQGVIQVSERSLVDIVGQSLELNYAQVRFNGSLTNPRLSVEAARDIEGNTIGLRIGGAVASPEIHVFNNAGLSDEQAMNALATGRLSDSGATQISEQGFRSQVTNSLAAAGLSVGLKGTNNLTNEIGRAIGLQSLVVDASGVGNDTNVNLTGYINPDLYIRYGVGVFNAESSLSMRYRLTRRVYLEATYATESIVDMVYRWRF